MGQTSKRLRRKLQQIGSPFQSPDQWELDSADRPTAEQFVERGFDPLHASYICAQNMASIFAESVSQFPEMRKYTEIAGDAEDEYMPSAPPMSPLTLSYFTCWAFFDLRFSGNDTLGSCLIDAYDVLGLPPEHREALQKMSESRMGIYEHVGQDGSEVQLRELLTGKDFRCLSPVGYSGRKGEFWYVRLLPPLTSQNDGRHLVFTTPYVLIRTTRDDWMQFLRRTLAEVKGRDEETKLHWLLKYGLAPNYWNEFVFLAYHHNEPEVIYLAGIPDQPETLPQAQ